MGRGWLLVAGDDGVFPGNSCEQGGREEDRKKEEDREIWVTLSTDFHGSFSAGVVKQKW